MRPGEAMFSPKGLVFLCLLFFASCGHKKKGKSVDPVIDQNKIFETNTGFQFKFPMEGDWYHESFEEGRYNVGQKVLKDGHKSSAVVSHGNLYTPDGKPATDQQFLEGLKNAFFSNLQSTNEGKDKINFIDKKFKGADCFFYENEIKQMQPLGLMKIANDGIVCMHPSRPAHFIWMLLTERTPVKKEYTFSIEDKNKFWNTLEFLK